MSAAPGPSVRQVVEPCPFCGGTEFAVDMKPPYGEKAVYCCLRTCGTSGPWAPTKEQAIAAWNRRAAVPAVAELASRVEEFQRRMVAQSEEPELHALLGEVARALTLNPAGEEKDHG